jgi:nucleotidyltransferase/DNA polymerase involved in DNA repair
MNKQDSLKELQKIPGIGKSLSEDLYNLGFRKISDLKNQDPEKMYQRQCQIQGMHVDRCVLYTFRCAVYFASHTRHDPHLLKWWNWKD